MSDSITLTDEQGGAVKAITKWYKSVGDTFKYSFVMGGYAGTGKSTLVPFVVDSLGLDEKDLRFVAYTGKAAMVLRKKGLPATTIHSLIYRPRIDDQGKVTFHRRPFVELERVKLIICDESSMIGRAIRLDLESFGIPILYIGDHFQLPPVSKDQINLMERPDYRLETIHRQALDNPIVQVAHMIRTGEYVGYGRFGDSVMLVPEYKMKDDYLMAADQVVCGFNNTRRNLNAEIRRLKGFEGKYPQPEDKLICLKNNNENGLVNGMLGKCLHYNQETAVLSFVNDDEITYEGLDIDSEIFRCGTASPWEKGIEQFDFGYALTCHKFQGSEAGKVVVFEELFGDDEEMHRRWKYTAYTRASEKLIVVK